MDVKHRPSSILVLRRLNRVDYCDIANGLLENFFKKSVQQEQKQVFALLAGESLFKCGVQSKRCKLWMFVYAGIASSIAFTHNPPRGKKIENQKIDAKNIAPSPALESRKSLNHVSHSTQRRSSP
jgi:hypothetical protein